MDKNNDKNLGHDAAEEPAAQERRDDSANLLREVSEGVYK